jgi:hypothetical protein
MKRVGVAALVGAAILLLALPWILRQAGGGQGESLLWDMKADGLFDFTNKATAVPTLVE